MTVNGPGTVIGNTPEGTILIAHRIAQMIGCDGGTCLTPQCKIQGVWEYKPEDVKLVSTYESGAGKQAGIIRKKRRATKEVSEN